MKKEKKNTIILNSGNKITRKMYLKKTWKSLSWMGSGAKIEIAKMNQIKINQTIPLLNRKNFPLQNLQDKLLYRENRLWNRMENVNIKSFLAPSVNNIEKMKSIKWITLNKLYQLNEKLISQPAQSTNQETSWALISKLCHKWSCNQLSYWLNLENKKLINNKWPAQKMKTLQENSGFVTIRTRKINVYKTPWMKIQSRKKKYFMPQYLFGDQNKKGNRGRIKIKRKNVFTSFSLSPGGNRKRSRELESRRGKKVLKRTVAVHLLRKRIRALIWIKKKHQYQTWIKNRFSKMTRLKKKIQIKYYASNWDKEFEKSPLTRRVEYLVSLKKKRKKKNKVQLMKWLKREITNKIRFKKKWLYLKKESVMKKVNQILFINDIGTPRHFPSATQEWSNSMYSYNIYEMRSVTGLDLSVNKLIKSYFTSIPSSFKKINQITRRKTGLFRKNWKLRTNKVYLSKSELKHTSSKVTITVFVYAERHINLRYLYKYLNKENLTLSMVKDTGLYKFKYLIDNYPNLAENVEFIKKTQNNYHKYLALEKKSMKTKNFLEKKISKCYKKKVVFKIIRLKYLYLNNNMLAEFITLKLLRKKKNLYKAKRKIFRKIKFPYVNIYAINQIRLAKKTISQDSYRNQWHGIRGKHIWDEWKKNKYFRPEINEPFRINKTYQDFLNYINYKFPFGIRLEIAGRLTRRNVAARSVKKYTYRGSLKNIDSTYRNRSITNLRSCHEPNVEFTKRHSVARTGAFTVRSWLSKY